MSDVVIPEFLDPVLDFLYDVLPPSLYSVVETVLAHIIAVIMSLYDLAAALIISSTSSWDVQKILPPIITLLAAYLALLSFYRTSRWMISTAFAFVKWGTFFGILGIAAGYVLANANVEGGNGVAGLFAAGGLIPAVGGLILDLINGQSRDAAGNSRRTRSQGRQSRPKVWESWDRHRDWQYSETDEGKRDVGAEVKKVVNEVLGTASKVVRESRWWEAATGARSSIGEEGADGGRQSSRRSRDRTSRSR